MSSRSVNNPMAMAFKILEEYKDKVRDTLERAGCTEELRNKILKDLYTTSGAYLSLNRAYKRYDKTFMEFCVEKKLHSLLPKMFPSFKQNNLYEHQVQAIDSILEKKTTIISTGTGSGKTESFLIPLLDHCLKTSGTSGIKAIILYPMNALASDQLRRIKEAAGKSITVGCYIGSTSQAQRDTMVAYPPDILITNYVMLDRLLTKERTRSMFTCSAQTLQYLVVDEIHSYRGTKGANLCLLLRRLRAVCRDTNQLVQIGASATLRQGGGYYSDDDQKQIQDYTRAMFGQEAVEHFEFITPAYDDEGEEQLEKDLLSQTDQIVGDSLIIHYNPDAARKIAEQLSCRSLPLPHAGRKEIDPMYRFVKRNPFIQAMRVKLKVQACTIDDLVSLFRNLYLDMYHQEPRDAKGIVYGYLSVINELNRDFKLGETSIPDVVIDYRLHLVLDDLGGNLTRCLLCGCYHDGLRTHCRICNGILFPVSRNNPLLCLARCNGLTLSPRIGIVPEGTRNAFTVLVERVNEQASATDTNGPQFTLEPVLDVGAESESYRLHPASPDANNIRIIWSDDKVALQELELEKPRLYWQNMQRVVDAVLVRPETQIAPQLLGFIDNREKASSIRFRLRDEIAERALTNWAFKQWAGAGTLPLLTAYRRLEKQMHDDSEEKDIWSEIKQEMPFWFARMVTRLNEYEDMWHVRLDTDVAQGLQEQERKLINDVFLPSSGKTSFPHCAIDRTDFGTFEVDNLKHFFLEKYRVTTEYGVGLRSVKEQGYDVVSLGEQGRIYQDVIEEVGSDRIEPLLSSLVSKGILLAKETNQGTIFYQLSAKHLVLECCSLSENTLEESELFPALIECHTADNTDKERAESEEKFRSGKIQALVCTPTLEMGVDIGNLSCVIMIGFPPSPASYAQRAGRAGRGSSLRSAVMIVLSSSGNSHDDYYAADPRKIIEGTITPPQFTLANKRLLASHIYAHVLAGNDNLRQLSSAQHIEQRLRLCIMNDELTLRSEFGAEYEQLLDYLYEDVAKWIGKIRDHEQGYREGFFPDYGFRRDGVPLVKSELVDLGKTRGAGVLTTREPEEAVRKLIPERVVFCSGRPIRVAAYQSERTYSKDVDASGKPFRAYTHLVAEDKDDLYVYVKRESDMTYQLTRTLYSKVPVPELPTYGPGYCSIQLVRQGKLYIVNEGKHDNTEGNKQQGHVVPFQDDRGEYRIGTCLIRDGLLIHLSEQILHLNTRANFLAILLRSIPDYFNLDDGELRAISNVTISFKDAQGNDDKNYVFLYGHDESGLVPFVQIAEHLTQMLEERLQKLEDCTCNDGCYRCLFSFGSQYLTGILSRRDAIRFLRSFLQLSLLQPHIPQQTSTLAHPDILMKVELRGQCEVSIENYRTQTSKKYTATYVAGDQNAAVYTTINTALTGEVAQGAHTVKILCKPEYIADHLQGNAKVMKGREAFMRLLLTLRSWDTWAAERNK